MARRLAPASRWGLGSRSEPGLWLAPGLWSESGLLPERRLAPASRWGLGSRSEPGLLPERRLEPEWMRTSGLLPAAAVGDELVSGPEQANRVVRATKSAQYSSFDMAVVLLLRLGSFPSVG